ncbi:MAG: N-acetyltransferase [Planctomycetota bacterium]
MIRRATIADVPAMGRIINDAAEFGLMLPKSLATLYENVREFHVVEDERTHDVVGVCGLSVIWAGLAEIVSLAVLPSQRGKGLGKQLVEACLAEAEELGIGRVMSLTYERAFFERLGFSVVDRQELPLKVWADCVRCPKNEACDEIAMIRVIEGVTEPAEAPAVPSGGIGAPDPVAVPITSTAVGSGGKNKQSD